MSQTNLECIFLPIVFVFDQVHGAKRSFTQMAYHGENVKGSSSGEVTARSRDRSKSGRRSGSGSGSRSASGNSDRDRGFGDGETKASKTKQGI